MCIRDRPKGLHSVTHEIFAINNDNGSTVSKLVYDAAVGIVTCTLVTPILGFSVPPFSVDEEIFVEGLEKFGYTGTGNYIDGLLPGVYNVELNSTCPDETYYASYEVINPDILELNYTINSSCEGGEGVRSSTSLCLEHGAEKCFTCNSDQNNSLNYKSKINSPILIDNKIIKNIETGIFEEIK